MLADNSYSEEVMYTVIKSEMKNIIDDEEKAGFDPYETTYEKALLITAAYRILKHHMKDSDFKEYCELRRKHREASNDL